MPGESSAWANGPSLGAQRCYRNGVQRVEQRDARAPEGKLAEIVSGDVNTPLGAGRQNHSRGVHIQGQRSVKQLYRCRSQIRRERQRAGRDMHIRG